MSVTGCTLGELFRFGEAMSRAAQSAAASSDDKTNSIWSILPSFDPAVDDPKEYSDKVKFLANICPARDKSMLAPRLAMLLKGTAWAQMTKVDASKLSDPEQGVQILLQVISQWEEAEEMQKYERFERAIYRISQKPDESNVSYVNRIQVAFKDIESVQVAEVQAFVLLRQSTLGLEDKKRVLSMTGGELTLRKVDNAMRQLAPRILVGNGGEAKKRVYPVNYMDEVAEEEINQTSQQAFLAEEETHLDEEAMVAMLAEQGDQDAILIAEFEEQLVDSVQDNPELSLCFSAYSEARGRIRDRIRSRGFWPPQKGGAKARGKGKMGAKGGNFRRKQSLADRIASSHCRICGAKGHWKQECPQKSSGTTAEAHVTIYEDSEVQGAEIVDWVESEEPGDEFAELWKELCQKKESQKIPQRQCMNCGKNGHWRTECPCRSESGRGQGSNHEVAMIYTITEQDEKEQIECPRETAIHSGTSAKVPMESEFEIVMNNALMKADTPAAEPNKDQAGRVKSHQCESWVNEEFIFVSQTHMNICHSLKTGIRGLNVLGRHSPQIEPILFVDQGCPAILDTGASKSVIGRKRVETLLQSLPDNIQKRIQWKSSETVFRFGNNATLPSVGAMYIPFGKKWMRLEVVEGETPFLLSNAFLKVVAADVCTSTRELKLFHGTVSVGLRVNRKGLFLIELSEILKAVMSQTANLKADCEVVTALIEEKTKETIEERNQEEQDRGRQHPQQTLPTTAARVVQKHSKLTAHNSKSDIQDGQEDQSLCRGNVSFQSRSPAGFSRGSESEQHRHRRCEDRETSRHSESTSVGRADPGRWQTPREDVQSSGGWRCGLCPLHDEQERLHIGLGTELPQLCAGQRTHGKEHSDAGADAPFEQRQQDPWRKVNQPEEYVGLSRGADGKHGSDGGGHIPSQSDDWCQEGQPGVGRHGHDADRIRCDSGGGPSSSDCYLAARVEQDQPAGVPHMRERPTNSKVSDLTQRESSMMDTKATDFSTNETGKQLAMLTTCIEAQLDELATWSVTITTETAPRSKSQTKPLDLLEIYCEPESNLTKIAQQQGLRARRFTRQDGDLRTEIGQKRLWEILEEERPKHVWVSPDCRFWGNFARFNMNRSLSSAQKIQQGREEERANLELCQEIYWFQVSQGRHFHMEQPQGSEMLEQKEVEDISWGTYRTVFDMCEVGKLRLGNNFLRKRTIVYTTSRTLHETLDSRYCRKNHPHRQIAGKVRYLNKWVSLSGYAARYSVGFVRHVVEFLKGDFEDPVVVDELCLGIGERDEERALALEVVKRRRLHLKQTVPSQTQEASEGKARKENRPKSWQGVFRSLNGIAPRVGSVVVGLDHEVVLRIQGLCPKISLCHVEVCRGTDRFRVPKAGTDVTNLRLRQTVIMHRQSGEVHELGEPEEWQQLSQRQKIRKSGPAKLCLTLFGDFPSESSGSGRVVESEMKVVEEKKRQLEDADEPEAKRPCDKETEETEIDVVGKAPPQNVTRHGPKFLELGRDEQDWLKKIHHRLGHPDPAKIGRYLKTIHADVRLIAGALDYQCDACTESEKGFRSARPCAIHDDIGFNHTMGLDGADWTSAAGAQYHFVHFIDEGTLFHVARPCREDAVSQMEAFEDFWMSWAGPPPKLVCGPC